MKTKYTAIRRVISSVILRKNQDSLANDRQVIAEIGRVVTNSLGRAETLQRLFGLVNEIIPCDRITITSVDPVLRTFRLTHVLGTEIPDIEEGDVLPLANSFVAEVISLGTPIRFIPSDKYHQQIGFVTASLLSRIATPLSSNGQVVGTFHVASKKFHAFTFQDLIRLDQIGHQISGSVANELLLEAERLRTRQLEAMYQLAEILAGPQTFEAKAQRIADTLVQVSGADLAIVRRLDRDGINLEVIAESTTGGITFEPTISIADTHSATSEAFREERTLLINDYQRYPSATHVIQAQGVESVFATPLKANGQTLGFLSVASKTENYFNKDRVELLTALADGIVPLFESADLSESLRTSQGEMALVDEIARMVGSTLNIQDVYENFATEIKKLILFDRMTIATIDPEQETIMVRYTTGVPIPGRSKGDVGPLHESESYAIVKLGLPRFRGNLMTVSDIRSPVDEKYRAFGFCSSACVPMMSRGNLIGTLGFRSKQPGAFGAKEQAIINRLADQIAPAVENAILYQESFEAEQIQRSLSDENASMSEIGRIAASPFSDKDVYRRFANAVRKLIQFDRISITSNDVSNTYSLSEYILGTNVPGWYQGATKRLDGLEVPFISEIIANHIPVTLNPSDEEDLREKYPTLAAFYQNGLRSFIGCRLTTNGQVIGTIQLASLTPGLYGEHEAQILQKIGNQVAGSIANATLLQVERDRVRQLEALREVAEVVAQPLHSNQKIQAITDILFKATESDLVTVRRGDNQVDALQLLASANSDGIIPVQTLSVAKLDSSSSKAFFEARTIVIDQYQDHPDAQLIPIVQGIKSAITTPILANGQTLGLLSVGSKIAYHFGQERISLVSIFAAEIGSLIETIGLSDVLQASREELAIADEIARTVTSTLDFQDVSESFAKEVKALVDLDRITIATIDHEKGTVTVKYNSGENVTSRGVGDSVPIIESTTHPIVENGLPIFEGDYPLESSGISSVEKKYTDWGFRSRAIIPLKSGGELIGSMILRSRRVAAFGLREQTIIKRLANQIAPALKNVELHESAKRLAHENAIMAEIGRIIASPLSTEEVYKRFAETVRSLVQFDRISIVTFDPAGEYSTVEYVLGTDVPGRRKNDTTHMSQTILPKIVEENGAILFNLMDQNYSVQMYPSLIRYHEAGLRSFIGAPFSVNNNVIGTLHLYSKGLNDYTQHEANIVQRIGNQIAGNIASTILLKSEQNKIAELEALYSVSAIMAEPIAFEAKCRAIVETMVNVTDMSKVVLRRIDDNQTELALLAVASDDDSKTEQAIKLINMSPNLGKAFDEGQSIIVNDYANHIYGNPDVIDRGVKSTAIFPIKSNGRVLGTMSMGSKLANHFTADRVALLTAFSDEIGTLFKTNDLSIYLQATKGEMDLADEVAKILTATLDVEEAYGRFAVEARKLVEFDRINIGVINHDDNTFVMKYSFGPSTPGRDIGQILPMNYSENLAAIAEGTPVFIDDLAQDAKTKSENDYQSAGVRSSAVVPLISKSKSIGALGFHSGSPGLYGPREQMIIIRLANLIAPAVDNAILFEQSLESERVQHQLADENAAMAKIGRIISSPFSDDGVYDEFTDVVQGMIPFDRITITTCDSKGRSNVNLYVKGIPISKWEEGFILPLGGSGFASELIAQKRALIFNPENQRELAERFPYLSAFHKMGLRSFIGSPLLTNGRVVGNIFLSSTTPGFYTQDHADLLQQIGNQVAGSVASTTLLQSERDRTNQLEATYAVSAIMAQPLSLEAKCQSIVDTLVRIMDVDTVVIRRNNNLTGDLELIAGASENNHEIVRNLSQYTDGTAWSEAYRNERPVIVNDYEIYPKAKPDSVARRVKSAFTIPVKYHGQTLGLLSVGSKTRNHFTDSRVAMLTAFSEEIGALFGAAGLSDTLQASQEEMALADEIADIISSGSDIDDICEGFTLRLKNFVDFDLACLATFDLKRKEITIKYSYGQMIAGHEKGHVFALDDSDHIATLMEGHSSFSDDLSKDEENSRDFDYMLIGMRSKAVVPLISQGQAIGTIALRSTRYRAFGARERSIITRLANQIAPAVENAMLIEQSLESQENQRRLNHEKSALAEIGHIAASPLSDQDVFQRFADVVQTLVQFDHISVATLDSLGESLTKKYVLGIQVPGREQGTVRTIDFEDQIIRNRIKFGGPPSIFTLDEAIDSNDGHFDVAEFYRAGLSSAISCRLVTNDQVVGFLNLYSLTPNCYSGHESQLLDQIANQVAGSISSGLMLQMEQERVSQLQALYEVSATIARPISLQAKAQNIVEKIVEISGADQVFLRRYDADKNSLEFVASAGTGKIKFLKNLDTSENTASNEAFRNGRLLVINNYANFPDALPRVASQGLASLFEKPIISNGRTLGLLSIASKTTNHFDPGRIAHLTAIADGIGALFDAADLTFNLQASKEEMALVDRIAGIITSSTRMDDVYQNFSDELQKLVPFDRMVVNVINHADSTFGARFVSGTRVSGREQGTFNTISDTIVEKLILTGESLIRHDFRDERLAISDNLYIDRGLAASIGIPLISNMGVIATLHVHSKRKGIFGAREQAILERLASQITPAVENAILFEESVSAQETQDQLAQELAAKNDEMALADRIAEIITSSTRIEDVYSNFSDELKKLIEFDRIVVNDIDEEAGISTTRFVAGLNIRGRGVGYRFSFTESINGELVQSGQAAIRNDLMSEKTHLFQGALIKAGLRSSVALPLISNRGIVAILHLHSKKISAFGPRELEILERLSSQITPAVSNYFLNDALLQGEARNRAVLETTADGIITIDENGTINSFNPAAEAIFGYSSVEVVGESVGMLMLTPDQAAHNKSLPDYLKTNESQIIGGAGKILDGRHCDGTFFPMELWVGVVSSNQERGFIGIVRRVDQTTGVDDLAPGVEQMRDNTKLPLPRLTNREVEVLHILADGGRNKDVAEEMTVSLHTVKFHIENLYAKLDVRTRGELIRVATRLGFLT